MVTGTDREVWDALARHGYNPSLEPRGTAGGPGEFDGYMQASAGLKMFAGNFICVKLRNWVCVLDGVIIDGHSDPDFSGVCVHCGAELTP